MKVLSLIKGLRTTTIGSYPKPSYLKIPDWFKLGADTRDEGSAYESFISEQSGQKADKLEKDIIRATKEVIRT